MKNQDQLLLARYIALPIIIVVAVAIYICRITIGQVTADQPRLKQVSHSPKIEMGIFSPEAARRSNADLSIFEIQYRSSMDRYHQKIRELYGRDMSDFCYLSIGNDTGWRQRYSALRQWIFNSARYGEPTIALEPNGPTKYRIIGDNEQMRTLKSIFRDASRRGITIWIRFASECNLENSPYSIAHSEDDIRIYRQAARGFRLYMPSNIHLVFSPLINTSYQQSEVQLQILNDAYERGVYARIGGTLYATSNCDPVAAFDWYYYYMQQIDPDTPFQICEFEGMLNDKSKALDFLRELKSNRWPKVQKISLFAGPLNHRAEKQYSCFGWVEHGANSSFAKDILAENS